MDKLIILKKQLEELVLNKENYERNYSKILRVSKKIDKIILEDLKSQILLIK
ncbi:MAG: hypothetical protein RSA08_03525 [Clostridia bacterium]